jgi:hypothetical protein
MTSSLSGAPTRTCRMLGRHAWAALLARLENKDSELLRVDLDEQGAVVVSEADGEGDVNDLLTQIERAMNRR